MSLEDEIKAILSDDSKVDALVKLFEEHKSGNKSTKEPELKEGQWCFMWDDHSDSKKVLKYKKAEWEGPYRHVAVPGVRYINASIIDEPILTWFPYEGFKPDWIDDEDKVVIELSGNEVGIYKGKLLNNTFFVSTEVKQFALFQRAKK